MIRRRRPWRPIEGPVLVGGEWRLPNPPQPPSNRLLSVYDRFRRSGPGDGYDFHAMEEAGFDVR